ncbi:hypothetical protein SCB17_001425 [Clostridium perfringens]|nr:hypothetical protein [Clostridium perfringens]MDU3844138.1 P-loop NTPase fold protein [Clostridium perfringens]
MNNYIEEFLDGYIRDDTYNYAVMINGDWGSGKTFFVKNYICNHNNKEKFLYLSLYGIKNLDEISKDIYAQIIRKNSIYAKTIGKLEEKKISVLGNIGGRIAIDLCKSNGINIDGIKNIYKNLVDLNKYIFVFDDFERSLVDMNEILGYINNLVEHSGIKAIIITNEPKIADESYKEIKEKLIANTVRYEPNIEIVFKILINELKENDDIKNSLLDNIKILENKNNKNIRTYQFFLSKYKRAYKKLYDLYDGMIEKNLLKKIIEEMYDSAIAYKNGQEEDSPRNLAFISNYIYLDIWDMNEVEKVTKLYIEEIKRNKCQYKLNKLTCWYVLEDEQIVSLLKEIKEEIKEDKYSAKDFVKIVRLGLIIKDKGFEEKYLKDIINEMKEKSYKSQELESVICLNDGYFSNNQEKNKQMSLEFKKIISDIARSFDENSNKKDIKAICEILKQDNWIERLQEWLIDDKYLNNRENFGLCIVKDLIDKIKDLNNKDICKLRNLFDEFIFYKKDKLFLEGLKQEVEALIYKENKIVKKELLKWFSEDIERALKELR